MKIGAAQGPGRIKLAGHKSEGVGFRVFFHKSRVYMHHVCQKQMKRSFGYI